MKKERITDMTTGSPIKHIAKFAVPILAGNLLQQFYTIVDAIVVGQGVGVEGLAAIGATDWIYWLFLWTTYGFATGFTIHVTISFGEKSYENVRYATMSAVTLSLCVGVAMAITGLIAAKPLLTLLKTPEAIFSMSQSYVMTLYAGIVVVMLYNTVGSVLRSLGDSKTPFIALIISSLLNIGLDVLFVLAFGWGVGGAAAATVISQFVAVSYTWNVLRRVSILKGVNGSLLSRANISREWFSRTWRKGWPMALQMSFVALGGVVIQFVVNGMGLVFIAGYTAGTKLIGLVESISIALGNAVTTYVGQNYGAGNDARISRGLRDTMIVSGVAYVLVAVVLTAFGENILAMFVNDSSADFDAVMMVATRLLRIILIFMAFLYFLNIYRGAFVGIGSIAVPLLSGLMECVCRMGMSGFVAQFLWSDAIYFAEISSWVGAGLLLIILWYLRRALLTRRI